MKGPYRDLETLVDPLLRVGNLNLVEFRFVYSRWREVAGERPRQGAVTKPCRRTSRHRPGRRSDRVLKDYDLRERVRLLSLLECSAIARKRQINKMPVSMRHLVVVSDVSFGIWRSLGIATIVNVVVWPGDCWLLRASQCGLDCSMLAHRSKRRPSPPLLQLGRFAFNSLSRY